MKRIHDSLRHVFQRHRLVFWYDSVSEWTDAFESFAGAGIVKLRVTGNEWIVVSRGKLLAAAQKSSQLWQTRQKRIQAREHFCLTSQKDVMTGAG
jgi:hypothetical protein